MLLKFHGPGMCRNRPDVGNIFMQCLLHLLRRYFVPLPWRFLTQPELQQGSDRLNCSQKHILMCIFSCSSELEWHFGPAFSVTPARRSLFLAARNFEPATRNFESAVRNFEPLARNFVSAQNFDLSNLVTMSAMPPVDNYIRIILLKTRDRP